MRLSHVWIALTIVGAFIGPASSPLGLETWASLALGRWIVEHGTLPTSDPFTTAPLSATFIDQQWLAQLALFGTQRLAGFEGVIVLTALAIAAAYGLVLAASITSSGRVRLACVSVWLAYALGATNLTTRAQTLSYPLFGLFVLAIARAEWRKDTALLWPLPLATVIWANVHGSFFLGLVLLACSAVGRPRKAYWVCLAACAVATLVTPYGPGVLGYVAQLGNNTIVRQFASEWAPTSTATWDGALFFVSVLLVFMLLLRSPVRVSRSESVTLVAFGLLGLLAVRNIVWWGMILAPIVARLLSRVPEPGTRERPAVNWGIACALAAVGLVSVPWIKTALPFLPPDKVGLVTRETPVRAAEFLRALPRTTLFNELTWGGYLDWAGVQPFVDGRFELHPTQVWLDYLAVSGARSDWPALFDRYGITRAVLSPAEQRDLIAALRRAPGWQVLYEDDQAIVFEHQAGA